MCTFLMSFQFFQNRLYNIWDDICYFSLSLGCFKRRGVVGNQSLNIHPQFSQFAFKVWILVLVVKTIPISEHFSRIILVADMTMDSYVQIFTSDNFPQLLCWRQKRREQGRGGFELYPGSKASQIFLPRPREDSLKMGVPSIIKPRFTLKPTITQFMIASFRCYKVVTVQCSSLHFHSPFVISFCAESQNF